MAKLLLKASKAYAYKKNKYKETPLLRATRKGHKVLIKLLEVGDSEELYK